MSIEQPPPVSTPCLCNALRRASRAVSRLYDEELRGTGLRTTQYSLLSLLDRAGEVRQRELSGQKLVAITEAGAAKLEEARPTWERAQQRMRSLLPEGVWQELMAVLPDVARRAAEA
jgi:DNA-binding PadR family transcriptional regulator